MAVNPVPVENYPSSSQDGQAIPLAAVRPIGCYTGTLAPGEILQVTLPADTNLVSFYCAAQGKLVHTDEETNGELSLAAVVSFEPNAFIFMPGVNYELVLGKHLQVSSEKGGLYVINVLMKWGQMRNEGSYLRS